MNAVVYTNADALRAALMNAVKCGAADLEEAIGAVSVATAADLGEGRDVSGRSAYDPASRVMVLLADRIPLGLEMSAIVAEMQRHHGRDLAERIVGELPQPQPLQAGDKVFVRSELRLATVLDVYGDGLNGDHGDVRLDLCGNTSLQEIEPYDPDLHSVYDSTFVPIKAEWKERYGITQEVPIRPLDEVPGIMNPVVRVELRNSDGEVEEFDFRASDVLKYHGETRSWAEVGRDESHQHLQMSLAEDYALYTFKRAFGDMDPYEVDVVAGLSDQEEELEAGDLPALVEASQFHSMRGHVAEGVRVRFSSGEELNVRSAMRGWNLESDDGKVHLGPFDGAMALTAAIVLRDGMTERVATRDDSPSLSF